jgi:hypothetical protein
MVTRTLILPSSATIHAKQPIARCRVPVGDGKLCGHPFFEGEERAMAAHVAKCCREHHDIIVGERERRHPDIMLPWDRELDRWVKENRDAILEGRKRI